MRHKGATGAQTAFAMRATRGAMGARALRVWRESTKLTVGPLPAPTVELANIQQRWEHSLNYHARRARQTHLHLRGVMLPPLVSVIRASQDRMATHVWFALRASIKPRREMLLVQTVQLASGPH